MRSTDTLMENSQFNKYRDMPESLLIDGIRKRKEALGKDLLILVHHYQKPEVVRFADLVGDSLELARKAAENKYARYIVFCGVHFMAECARILCDPSQIVLLPDLEAGCPLADSAHIDQVEEVWDSLVNICPDELIVPVTYVNSDAELKAFTGKNGGSVCTSSNAGVVLDWAMQKGQKVFFFPDEHLGRNTARDKSLAGQDVIVWDPELDFGGNTEDAVRRAKVILWNGFCHVHTRFKPEHVKSVRQKDPEARIVVHPECPEEVVKLSDASGSTSFIVKYVHDAPAGSRIVIGTEINLVKRLSDEMTNKTVYELTRSLCPNMFKIGLDDLLYTLDFAGEVNVIDVDSEIQDYSKIALERMLQLR